MKQKRNRFYWAIKIGQRQYEAQRLAHLYMTGAFPASEVDHRDLDSLNNRWENLRAATGSQNLANRGLAKNSSTGFKGVSFNKEKRKYKAHITVSRRQHHIGYFDTPEDAHAAYVECARNHFGEFARAA